ncbi:MAG: amino acid ABC transporter substrate-binding protein [Chromatiales bacterium]
MNSNRIMRWIVTGLLLAAASSTTLANTLETVKKHGTLRCGVNTGLPGFALKSSSGRWEGMDADFCRAVAAAVFGDAEKVEFIPHTTKTRLQALQNGSIDLLAHNVTWTMSRDLGTGLDFVGIYYFDGQGFMVRKEMKVRSALALNGSSICVLGGTTSEANVKEYFIRHQMKLTLVRSETSLDTLKNFEQGKCDVLTSDLSQLYALRTRTKKPGDYKVLPEPISKEPLGPVVREGDDNWRDIVQWTLFTLINAEEMGVSSHNIDRVLEIAHTPEVLRLLGKTGTAGKSLGLENDWSYQIILKVGNYGEIFERNLGKHTPLKMRRGFNSTWQNGGLLYAPPVR